MDNETRALLVEADSYLSLLLHRHVDRRKLSQDPVLEYEINNVISKLRAAVKKPNVSLEASSWYKVTGRGWAAAIDNSNDQLSRDIDPSDLLNQTVAIDGKNYFIIGVERQGSSRRNFGLLVRGDR